MNCLTWRLSSALPLRSVRHDKSVKHTHRARQARLTKRCYTAVRKNVKTRWRNCSASRRRLEIFCAGRCPGFRAPLTPFFPTRIGLGVSSTMPPPTLCGEGSSTRTLARGCAKPQPGTYNEPLAWTDTKYSQTRAICRHILGVE